MSDLNAIVLISGKTTACMHKDTAAEGSRDCVGEFDVTLRNLALAVGRCVWDLRVDGKLNCFQYKPSWFQTHDLSSDKHFSFRVFKKKTILVTGRGGL
jgi:hypothetical protein